MKRDNPEYSSGSDDPLAKPVKRSKAKSKDISRDTLKSKTAKAEKTATKDSANDTKDAKKVVKAVKEKKIESIAVDSDDCNDAGDSTSTVVVKKAVKTVVKEKVKQNLKPAVNKSVKPVEKDIVKQTVKSPAKGNVKQAIKPAVKETTEKATIKTAKSSTPPSDLPAKIKKSTSYVIIPPKVNATEPTEIIESSTNESLSIESLHAQALRWKQKFHAMESKYNHLSSIALTESKQNFDSFAAKAEARFKAGDVLIDGLRNQVRQYELENSEQVKQLKMEKCVNKELRAQLKQIENERDDMVTSSKKRNESHVMEIETLTTDNKKMKGIEVQLKKECRDLGLVLNEYQAKCKLSLIK